MSTASGDTEEKRFLRNLANDSIVKYQGIPIWTNNKDIKKETGLELSIGGTSAGTKAGRWWIRCSNTDGSQYPPSEAPPGSLGEGAALNATGYDRIGFWMHSDGADPFVKISISITSDDCSKSGYDYYKTLPFRMDWIGWRWIALSLIPGNPQAHTSLEAVHTLANIRTPLPAAASIQRIVISEEEGKCSGSNTVKLGGGAVYKSLLISAREVFSGLVDDGSSYIRTHEVIFHEPLAGLVPKITTPLPQNVSMKWKLDVTNEILTIELRAETKNLLITNEDEDIDFIRIELVPSSTSKHNFPIELEISWAPAFRNMDVLESWKYAALNKKPYAWATEEQFHNAIEQAKVNDKNSWRNLTVSTLLEYAAKWPSQFVERWESVSPDRTIKVPPHGGQNIITYPTLCTDGSKAELKSATSTFECVTGYPPYECALDKAATHLGNGKWSCKDGKVPQKKWDRWPYTFLTYDMRHAELAEAALLLALAYNLGAGESAAVAAWDILLKYADVYEDYPRIMRDDNPETGNINIMAQMGYVDAGIVHSQGMEEAWWLRNIAIAYDLVRDYSFKNNTSKAQSSSAKVETKILRPGAALLLSYVTPGNHQSYHNLGLAVIGIAIQDFTLVNHAYERYEWGMKYQMETSGEWCGDVPCVNEAGAWYEGSFVYHMVALAPLVDTAHCLLGTGLNLFKDGSSLSKMINLPLLTMMPDTMLPRTNDANHRWLEGYGWLYEVAYYGSCIDGTCDPDAGYILSLSRDKYRKERNYAGILFGNFTLSQAEPTEKSHLLENAGFAALRQKSKQENNPTDILYALLDFGPHGGWHGHLDKLGIITYGLGNVRGDDPGTGSYKLANHNGWFRTTLCHNTVVVDESNQVEATGVKKSWHAVTGVASMVTASATDAYSTTSVYERSLVLTPNYLLDNFYVASGNSIPRKWDYAYHDYSGTNINMKGEKRVDGIAAVVRPVNDAEFAVEDSPPINLPNISGYNYLKSVSSYSNVSKWEVIFNNVETSNYDDHINGKAGYCSYTPYPLIEEEQQALWAENEDEFTSTIKLKYDVSRAIELKYRHARMYFVLNSIAQTIPHSSPVQLSTSIRGNSAATGTYLKFRIYDNARKFKEVNVGYISKKWESKILDVSLDGFVPPLKLFVPMLFWMGSGEALADVFLGNVVIDFDDGTKVQWSPIATPSGSSTSGTRLLIAEGESPTRAIAAKGIEEDLSITVPAVILRRQSPKTTFSVLHEFWRGAPGSTVQSYEKQESDCVMPVHKVVGDSWIDWVALEIPDAMLPSECSSLSPGKFGDFGTVKASYAYLRTVGGVQKHLAIKGGSMVGSIFNSENESDLDVTWEEEGAVRVNDHSTTNTNVEITLLDGEIKTNALYLNGKLKDFTTSGNNITFDIGS